jgi:hypothetical protein
LFLAAEAIDSVLEFVLWKDEEGTAEREDAALALEGLGRAAWNREAR